MKVGAQALFSYVLRLGDLSLVLGQRLGGVPRVGVVVQKAHDAGG